MKLNLQNGQQALRAYCPNIYTVVDSFTEKKGISQCKTLLFYDRKNWVLYVNRRRSSIETALDIKHIQDHLPTSSSSLSFWTTPYVHSLYIHWEKKVPLNAKYYSKMGWNQFWNRHSYFDLWLNWTINTARSFLFQKIKSNKKWMLLQNWNQQIVISFLRSKVLSGLQLQSLFSSFSLWRPFLL